MLRGSPFPHGAGVLAVANDNRWLIVFSAVAVVVLVGGVLVRRAARRSGSGSTDGRAFRRRAGGLIVIGPLVGLALAPSPDTLTVVAVVGAVALAGAGLAVERSRRADRLTLTATVVAALVAVIAGARFGPTGVDALDVIAGFAFIVVVTQAADGLGNVDGLAAGLGAASAAGLFALAAFGGQDDVATVALGLSAACFAFLAFNLRPASLYVGRAGRVSIGYLLAVGALTVDVVPNATRALVTPIMLVGVLLVDAAIVGLERLRRRQALAVHRPDHLVHRLAILGWSPGEAVVLLVIAQVVLSVIAVFTGRAVLSLWVGIGVASIVMLGLFVEASRGKLERDPPEGFSRPVKVAIGLVVLVIVGAVAPLAIVAADARTLMENGREAASRALAAARDGDTITASGSFREAALTFGQAHDKLASPLVAPGTVIPFVAPNVRAARALADIGSDLASAGESVAVAVDPETLRVVEGQLPLDEVRRVTPVLREGADALSSARRRLDGVRDDPYLAPPVREAVRKIRSQLARAEREAQHAAAAAELAPAIFGGDGPRTYLLVVQNNAEARATGGFIGSYGLISARDGQLDVSDLIRTGVWNRNLRDLPDVSFEAPADYRDRYTLFAPATTLQNVNLSPDFPSVAQVLMSLAPQAGLAQVDGVLAVDPQGLAALLELTGPVDVEEWPTPITAANVVDVTLRDAYAAFERTPERADFLGDVAQVTVDEATSGNLGKPADIARVLGAAAHQGHLVLAFARPEEQQLADELGVSGRLKPARADAIAVTSSNQAGNKIDYYLHRDITYSVRLRPNARATEARVTGNLALALDNTATAEGLPQIVIGPFDPRFVAGQNRSYVSIYSPLRFATASTNGSPASVATVRERGRNVYSVFTDVPAVSSASLETRLTGAVALHNGWYELEVRHQPTVVPDRVHVTVEVPKGWRIDKAPGMERAFDRRVNTTVDLDRTRVFRVHVVRDPGTWDLWERLEAGV